MKLKRRTESRLLIMCLLIMFVLVAYISYQAGAEDGYWEHEAEENAYFCEVFT